MADNRNLKNNSNIYTTLEEDRVEHDAIHHRLTSDSCGKTFFCQSCKESFLGTSREVYEHYNKIEHEEYYKLCCYCQGKVHQYLEERTKQVQVYHSCLRWRNGENK